ncbi:MAG: site-specific DNA-methyltransferase [Chitinophagaceae bacterium]|nr:MAG: site-specific DNA-methyltransferase [Chitinophagaceae bacterium]
MPTLQWIGKEKVVNHHHDVPFRVLDHQYSFIDGKETEGQSENKIIHGDNLEALKSLLPEFEGRIGCIYIDPPYNTGNENWVYNDNVNDPRLKKWLSQVVGKEGDDLSRHDKWLCMMYPRLQLLHRLLSSDGAIFISIDDNEHSNLRLILDEIFGVNNFVDNIIWQKNFSPKNSAKHFSASHDFVIVFAKDKDRWSRNLLKRDDTQNMRYSNPDNDVRGPWTSGDLSARNPYSLGIYPITTPSGRVIAGPPKGTYWRYSQDRLRELDEDNRIWWGADGNNVPRLKRFLSEIQDGVVPQTIWMHTEVGNTQEAKKEINSILNDVELNFDTPKPSRLLKRILEIGANKETIVLDSFAGSGTTAQAVLGLNKEDGGNRRFILVEMEEYSQTITAERVKRVITGYGDVIGTGGSFSYFNLGLPLFDENNNLNEQVAIEQIREYIYYSETRKYLPDAVKSAEMDVSHFLAIENGTAYYFYYDKSSLTSLDSNFLSSIRTKADQYVIYADNCLLSKEFMARKNIVFKKIPRDITRF